MRKYNFLRPIFILVVAYLINNIVTNICLALGTSPEAASNAGMVAMVVAVLIIFIRITKNRNKS